MIPDPSAARLPSRSQASEKIVGNMIEFISPIASRLYAASVPLLLVDSAISAIAPIATAARILPGLTSRSSAEPMKRPIIAPPQ